MVLTVAARVVGDAGGAQLREASLTSAAVPAGAFAAQAVLVTSVGRQQLLLRSEEKAPLHGVPIPEPLSIYSQALSFGLCGVGLLDRHRVCIVLGQPLCHQGKARAVIVVRSIPRRGGQALFSETPCGMPGHPSGHWSTLHMCLPQKVLAQPGPMVLLLQTAMTSGHKSGPQRKSTLSSLMGTWAYLYLICGCSFATVVKRRSSDR